jgi:hypothetical protein
MLVKLRGNKSQEFNKEQTVKGSDTRSSIALRKLTEKKDEISLLTRLSMIK